MNPHYLDVFNPLERLAFKLARVAGLRNPFYTLYQATRAPTPTMTAFRNRHAGQRCFILGGGPSLKLMDPTPLRHEITFGVNGCFLIFPWLGFEPTYYVVEDFLVFQDRWREILTQVNTSNCFFPVQFDMPDFSRPNHRYFRAIYEFDKQAGFPRFSTDPTRLIWIGGTVTYVCMQLAFFMGFSEIYLVGMDHKYVKPGHVSTNGNVWQSHGDDPNHFHKDYFGKGYRWHDPKVWRMELAYRKALEVFEAHGRKIYNATVGGNLEVFERVDYGSLF